MMAKQKELSAESVTSTNDGTPEVIRSNQRNVLQLIFVTEYDSKVKIGRQEFSEWLGSFFYTNDGFYIILRIIYSIVVLSR